MQQSTLSISSFSWDEPGRSSSTGPKPGEWQRGNDLRHQPSLWLGASSQQPLLATWVSLLLAGLLPHPFPILLVLVTTGAGHSEELGQARLGAWPLPTGLGLKHPFTIFLNANKVTVSKAHCVSKVRQVPMTCKICKLDLNKCCPQTPI